MENMQIQNCPCCPNHCPIDAVKCHRGEEIAEKLKRGEQIDIEEYRKEHGKHAHQEEHKHHKGHVGHNRSGHHGGHDHRREQFHTGQTVQNDLNYSETTGGKYKGIIFDLDGVICFTDEYHYQAWKSLADQIGVPFDRTINNRLRGVSRMASLEIILERSVRVYTQNEKEAMASEKNEIYKKLLEQMSVKDLSDDVKNVLDVLRSKGLKLAIGSSSRNTMFILKQIGLEDFFDAVSDGNGITRSKPDPEVFMKAAQKLELDPEECLVVEDAESGAQAGHAAGMKVACVGDAALKKAGDYNLTSIAELPDLFGNY